VVHKDKCCKMGRVGSELSVGRYSKTQQGGGAAGGGETRVVKVQSKKKKKRGPISGKHFGAGQHEPWKEKEDKANQKKSTKQSCKVRAKRETKKKPLARKQPRKKEKLGKGKTKKR